MSVELFFAIVGTLAGVLGLAVATYYGAMSLGLKSGTRVRGTYNSVSSVECEDKYVSNVTLENLKDRAVVIFGISLQVGRSNYIVLDEFDDEPLILQPFQAVQRSYGPIIDYTVNGQRIMFNSQLWDNSVKKRLVLDTSDGKYIVKESLRPWKVSHEAMRNDYTAVAHARRTTYKGETYGGNVKFLIHINADQPDEIVVPLHRHEMSYHKFRGFSFTPATLQTKETLQAFLEQQRDGGKFTPKDFFILDLDASRAKQHWFTSPSPTMEAPNLSWYEYHVEGRRATKQHWKTIRENNEQVRKSKEEQAAPPQPMSPQDSQDGTVI